MHGHNIGFTYFNLFLVGTQRDPMVDATDGQPHGIRFFERSEKGR
jgi:hypothetical protein